MQVLQTVSVVVLEALRLAQLVSLPLLSVAQVTPSALTLETLIACSPMST